MTFKLLKNKESLMDKLWNNSEIMKRKNQQQNKKDDDSSLNEDYTENPDNKDNDSKDDSTDTNKDTKKDDSGVSRKKNKDKDEVTNTQDKTDLKKVENIDIKVQGSLSEVYTSALQKVLNKENGINEYQLEEEDYNKTKDKKISKESQSQIVTDIGGSDILGVEDNEFKIDDDESKDPDYYYAYIGKNTDIENSDDVIKAIRSIIDKYNNSKKDNNIVLMKDDNSATESLDTFKVLLSNIGLEMRVFKTDNELDSYIKNWLIG